MRMDGARARYACVAGIGCAAIPAIGFQTLSAYSVPALPWGSARAGTKNPVISICFATHPSKYRPPTTSLQPPSSTTTLYSLLQLLPSNKLPKATTVKQPPSNSHRICNPPITYSCPSHLIQWPTPLIFRLSQRSSRSPHCPNRFLASGVASSAATSRISTSSLRSALCRSSTV